MMIVENNAEHKYIEEGVCTMRDEFRYSYSYADRLREPVEVEAYPVASSIVHTHAVRPAGKQRGRRALRVVVAAVSICALMLGSGVAGATLTERRMVALIDEIARSQAQTNAIVSDVAETVQNVAVAAGEFNPGREVMQLTELFVGANPAVVAISAETHGQNVFGRPVTRPSAGSGFVVSEDGYIVTNQHVIANVSAISVYMYDGTTHNATVVGEDFQSDLAVLKIEANGLSYLSFADSDVLMVGEQVVALGNPLGEFANSMTVGVVSALDREINIDGIPRNMLQTDAAINRGNSGGPLVNMMGQVVGVVTAKSGGSGVEGLGFAIPANVASRVAENLRDDGFVRGRAIMGVQIGMVVMGGEPRVYIDGVVSGSGANRAGVQPGDIIASINGNNVTSVQEVRAALDELEPGDDIPLVVFRNGTTLTLQITLDEFRPN